MHNRILFKMNRVATALLFGPLVPGMLSRLREMVQSERGPSILQSHRDPWKLFHKDQAISGQSSWIFRFAPSPSASARPLPGNDPLGDALCGTGESGLAASGRYALSP